VVQQYLMDHSADVVAAVLSGTAALELVLAGVDPSKELDLTAFNAPFPARTGYEWLSRDPDEVDQYVAEPMCGFGLDPDGVRGMVEAATRLVGAPPAQAVPEGVDVLGEVASVAEPLRKSALFVLPSLQEGFGLVVAEALAAGVPALVTPSGGPEDLVHDSGGGEVLESFDADELTDRAAALLGDGDRLLDMRRRGRAYVVREHDPARLRDALREALDELDAG